MSDQTNFWCQIRSFWCQIYQLWSFQCQIFGFRLSDAKYPNFGHFDITHDSKLGRLMSDIPIWVKMMSEFNQAILISESSILLAKYFSSHLANIDISNERKKTLVCSFELPRSNFYNFTNAFTMVNFPCNVLQHRWFPVPSNYIQIILAHETSIEDLLNIQKSDKSVQNRSKEYFARCRSSLLPCGGRSWK